jgi:hypothetical protein
MNASQEIGRLGEKLATEPSGAAHGENSAPNSSKLLISCWDFGLSLRLCVKKGLTCEHGERFDVRGVGEQVEGLDMCE